MKLSFDVRQASAYVHALTGGDDALTWLGLPETGGGRPSIVHGSLSSVWDALVRWNQSGSGIFLMVNAGDLLGASADNVVSIRAHFIDADGPLTRPLALPSTLSVQTPRGSHHYWRTTWAECDAFREIQKRLACYYRSDESVCDLPRKMRVPGLYHWKTGNPLPVRLTAWRPLNVYTQDDLVAAHPVKQPETPVVSSPAVQGSLKAFEAWAACKEVVMGQCHTTALKLASAGIQRGLDPSDVERIVLDYCERADAAKPAGYRSHCRMTPQRECRSIMRSVLQRHRK